LLGLINPTKIKNNAFGLRTSVFAQDFEARIKTATFAGRLKVTPALTY
jgi:hypothetical protein